MCTNFSGEKKQIFKPYQFKMEEIEGFRYRAQVTTLFTRHHSFIPDLKQINKRLTLLEMRDFLLFCGHVSWPA